MKISGSIIAVIVVLSGQAIAAENPRWYGDEQVKRGETLFRQHCASCHGQNAEATANWKQTDANGNYPPPPLNGTAHAWHHDLDLLRRTIRQGGAKIGGQMPGFEERLSEAEIDSVIAFFQAQWPDEIYERWSGRFASSELPSLTDNAVTPGQSVTRLLRQRLGNARIDEVSETAVEDVWQVQVGNQIIYLMEGGKYALMGDLVDLEGGLNLTEQSRRVAVVETISGFDDDDLAVFAAIGEPREVLNVFTDTSCPYCQKLHSEIDKLQEAGITVRYLPFPRGGSRGPGYQHLKSVWCAEDRNQALTDAKSERFDGLPPGDCAAAEMVDRGYRAGQKVGITGTPALIKSNGEKIEGYRPYQELIPLVLR